MKNSIKYLFIVASLLLLNSCSTDESELDENEIVVVEYSQETSDQILRLVNIHREGIGLSILEKNETAKQIAVDHTNYMISVDEINHNGFNERNMILINEENAIGAGENVARFSLDPTSLVAGWLDSDGHRENIEGNFTHTGIAAIQDSNGGYYYTQIFYR